MEAEQSNVPEAATKNGARKRGLLIVVGIVVLVGLVVAVRFWNYNRTHVTTDDAYLTSDVVPVSAQVAGNVKQVLVTDNQSVKKGDVLIVLDDATYVADVKQAEANLALAQASLTGAGADSGLTEKVGAAEVAQAEGGVQSGASMVTSAQSGVEKARQGVDLANAVLKSVQAQYESAKFTSKAKQASLDAAKQNENSAKSLLEASRASASSAQSQVKAAVTNAETTQRQAERMKRLYDEGAASQSDYEDAANRAESAKAAADSAKQQLTAAIALVQQRTAEADSAKANVSLAQAGLAQAQADESAAQQAVVAQQARIKQAQEDYKSAQAALSAAKARHSQAVAQLSSANALPEKVAASKSNEQIAQAKVEQAQAALDTAKIALDRTKIVAPVDGTVSVRSVQLGQQVSPGQPLLAVIPTEGPWVVANLKETQLEGLKVGQSVEVTVDAISGVVFKGKVDSISKGTGSVFALIPPDNASGNFTCSTKGSLTSTNCVQGSR